MPNGEPDISSVDRIVANIGTGRQKVLAILQAIQDEFRYLPEAALRRVCEITEIRAAEIVGVASFYNEFRHKPLGRHVISVCHGTACYVKGAPIITDALRRLLKIPEGEDTDSEGNFTLGQVACLGCCSLAPVVQIDNVIYGHLAAERLPLILHDFMAQAKQESARAAQPPEGLKDGYGEIRICLDSCCLARGAGKVYDAFQEALRRTGARACLKRVGCVIVCNETPLVEVVTPGGSFKYACVQPQDAGALLRRHFKPAGMVRRATSKVSGALERVLTDEAWPPLARYSVTMREPRIRAVLESQVHISTEHYGRDEPLDLGEYLAGGGFQALERCLRDLSPEQVIGEISAGGLRGRGGAGFPTGRKWALVRAAPGTEKYVICNGDEGDPGAFMDRMLLESFPYRVIEGMCIAAYAVGSNRGYMYIRSEYPFAVQRVKEALRMLKGRGYLGDDILGRGFKLELEVARGAGAFVCGEETALIAAIEGRRGNPTLRPPYPAERGLFGKPTLVNNVETLALVPWIIRNGASAFARLGTETSKGTKVFALAGKCVRNGLVEVPMGITIRRVVEETGGGVQNGRRLKAVLIGGPSGGCIPAEMADTPIDYEALTSLGAMMGSGGLIVLDESDCMVDVARYFLEFTQKESCGKCTFCRIGTRQMLEILTRLSSGHGKSGDTEELEKLATLVKSASLCGLGKTAPNPVLTTLRYFRSEYEAHAERRCPAARCKALITYSITDECIGCTRCAQHCPAEAIQMRPYEKHEIDAAKCIRCGSCASVCRSSAVEVH